MKSEVLLSIDPGRKSIAFQLQFENELEGETSWYSLFFVLLQYVACHV